MMKKANTTTKTVYRVRNPYCNWQCSLKTLKDAREVRRSDWAFKGPGSYIEKVTTITTRVR